MSAPDRILLLVFLLLSAALFFRISLESTHFLSPDSRYYLHMAANLVAGKGLVMTDVATHTRLVPVTIWPGGYPVLIAGLAAATGLSVFWASKLLNVLLLGGCLLLLRLLNKEKAWLLGLVFGSFTLIEVFSYTWSEVPFLFFLLLFAVAMHRCWFTNAKPGWWLSLFLAASGLFLMRYIGFFAVVLLGLSGMYFLLKKETRKSMAFLAAAFFSGLVVLGYFYRNYLINGHLTGSSRAFEHHETIGHFFWILVRGLFNQLMLFRQSYFKGAPDYLFWILAMLQFLWLGWVYVNYIMGRLRLRLLQTGSIQQVFLLVALAYLLVVVALRFFVPFDSFDFRILSPVALLVYLALVQALVTSANRPEKAIALRHIAFMLLFALLVNVLKPSFLMALFWMLGAKGPQPE